MPYTYKTRELQEGEKLVDVLNEERELGWSYDHESSSHPSVGEKEIILYKYETAEGDTFSDFNYAANLVYQNNKEKGFWPKDHEPGDDTGRNFGEFIALVHSELSEALEEKRAGKDSVYYNPDNPDKPEGWAVELADAVIRILDYAGGMNIQLGDIINTKVQYNQTRPHKHGKTF